MRMKAIAVASNLAPAILSRRYQAVGWLVHLFTATGAVLGLLALYAIYQGQWVLALWWMGAAIFVDGVDGTLARMADVDVHVEGVDGALLDNIIDYLNYVIVPAFFLMASGMLPERLRLLLPCLIVLASAYQFSQVDAKTWDHFFKGFPSYWNIVLLYLFLWQMTPLFNVVVLLGLVVLVFVPIKYVYPSRLKYFSAKRWIQRMMLLMTLAWGAATIGLLRIFPETNLFLVLVSVGYVLFYIAASMYRTFVPLKSYVPAGRDRPS